MYITRNKDGDITAISQEPIAGMTEEIAHDAPELVAYLHFLKPVQLASLEQTDQAMARVLEDVINLLVDQGTIRFTDLPQAAQTKLLSRRELRGQHNGMNLLDDGDDLNI